MNEKWVKIKEIVLKILAVAFVALVVFSPPLENPSASVFQAISSAKSTSLESVASNLDEGYIGQEVMYYGQLKRFSTSGSLAFYYYDIDKNALQYDDQHIWFWATLLGSEDYEKIKSALEFVANQSQSVIYKIVGTRMADDNSYYDSGTSKTSIQNIIIESIEVYNK